MSLSCDDSCECMNNDSADDVPPTDEEITAWNQQSTHAVSLGSLRISALLDRLNATGLVRSEISTVVEHNKLWIFGLSDEVMNLSLVRECLSEIVVSEPDGKHDHLGAFIGFGGGGELPQGVRDHETLPSDTIIYSYTTKSRLLTRSSAIPSCCAVNILSYHDSIQCTVLGILGHRTTIQRLGQEPKLLRCALELPFRWSREPLTNTIGREE